MRPAPFYSGSLNAETYDLGVGRTCPSADDVAFYLDLALASGPRVLELGCGTGRITIALAEAGLETTGLDNSAGMLREGLSKTARLAPATIARSHIVEGDMSDFDLGASFDTVLIPARAFAFLLTPTAQMACLGRVFDHLRPGGVLSIHVFDPRLDLCVPGVSKGRSDEGRDPTTGHTIRVEILSQANDSVAQVMRELWRFTEVDAAGAALRVEEEELVLRWTYRYEMQHLLAWPGSPTSSSIPTSPGRRPHTALSRCGCAGDRRRRRGPATVRGLALRSTGGSL